MEWIQELSALLLPLLAVQICFQVFCLINLAKRKEVRFGKKWIWAIIIIAFSLAGPVIYLLGRGAEE